MTKDVEASLQEAGFSATHLSTLFPSRDQSMTDEEIFRYAETHCMVVLTKNRYDRDNDPSVLGALTRYRTRSFCLVTRRLKRDEQVAAFMATMQRIVRLSRTPGPYLYGIYWDRTKRRSRIERLWPRA